MLGKWNLSALALEAAAVLTDPLDIVPRGFFPYDLNPGNVLITKSQKIKVIDQVMPFGDPIMVPFKLVMGWWKFFQRLADLPLAEAVTTFQAEKSSIDRLDQEMIDIFCRFYPAYTRLKQRLHAVLLIRHIDALLSIRKKYCDQVGLPQAEQVMAEYIAVDIEQMRCDTCK